MMFRTTNDVPRLMFPQSTILLSNHITCHTTLTLFERSTSKQAYDGHTLSVGLAALELTMEWLC
jgi:hypothetical protein